jgi:aminopeptidase N
MASYLAVAAIGDYGLRRFETSDGLYGLDAVDVDLDRRVDSALTQQEEVVDTLSRYFGPYPFDEIGAIVEDKKTLSFAALETQTRPIYDHRFIEADFASFVIAHELAHQWYGDSVSVHEWKHIWLNGRRGSVSIGRQTSPRADPLA